MTITQIESVVQLLPWIVNCHAFIMLPVDIPRLPPATPHAKCPMPHATHVSMQHFSTGHSQFNATLHRHLKGQQQQQQQEHQKEKEKQQQSALTLSIWLWSKCWRWESAEHLFALVLVEHRVREREGGVWEGSIFYLLATKQQRFEQHFNAPTVKWNMSDMQIFTHLNKYWLRIQLRIW